MVKASIKTRSSKTRLSCMRCRSSAEDPRMPNSTQSSHSISSTILHAILTIKQRHRSMHYRGVLADLHSSVVAVGLQVRIKDHGEPATAMPTAQSFLPWSLSLSRSCHKTVVSEELKWIRSTSVHARGTSHDGHNHVRDHGMLEANTIATANC